LNRLKEIVPTEDGIIDLPNLYLQACVRQLLWDIVFEHIEHEGKNPTPSSLSATLKKYMNHILAAALLFGYKMKVYKDMTKDDIFHLLDVRDVDVEDFLMQLKQNRPMIESIAISLSFTDEPLKLKFIINDDMLLGYILSSCYYYVENVVAKYYFTQRISRDDLISAAIIHVIMAQTSKSPFCPQDTKIGLKEEEILKKFKPDKKNVSKIVSWMSRHRRGIFNSTRRLKAFG
jgi:hypothetical protein